MATFRVRSMTHDDSRWMWDKAIELGWEISYGDPEAYWAADESGYFVGELDGKIISCVGCLKYTDAFAYVGIYIVDELYRGKGYGLKTFNVVMQSLPGVCVGIMNFPEHEAMYQKSGFKQRWRLHCKSFNITEVASIVCAPPKDFIIQSVTSAISSAQAINEYDSKCFFNARPQFIKESVFSTKEESRGAFVALDKTDGKIVGLIVVRQPISDKVSSYQVGPFYADSIEIASCLLKHTCDFLINRGLARQDVCVTYPESNPHAEVLADKFKAALVYTIMFMSTTDPPSYAVELVYSISSPATG